jgi:hypothetical protein
MTAATAFIPSPSPWLSASPGTRKPGYHYQCKGNAGAHRYASDRPMTIPTNKRLLENVPPNGMRRNRCCNTGAARTSARGVLPQAVGESLHVLRSLRFERAESATFAAAQATARPWHINCSATLMIDRHPM